jgi:3-hydroxybutyryl-CoA dehydratase
MVDDLTPSRFLDIQSIQIGDKVSQKVAFTTKLIDGFSVTANDNALIHTNNEFALSVGLEAPIIQGLCVTSRFSRLIGMYLPGEGSLVESLTFKFRKPLYLGSTVNFHVEVIRILTVVRVIKLSLIAEIDGVLHVEGGAQCLMRAIR